MSLIKTFIAAKAGAIIGTIILGPGVGTAIGYKLGALAASGGNPLALVGLEELGSVADATDAFSSVASAPVDVAATPDTSVLSSTIHGGPEGTDIHGNVPKDIQGNEIGRNGQGNPPRNPHGNPMVALV